MEAVTVFIFCIEYALHIWTANYLYPGKVFTKQQIYEHGWGEDYIVADNNIMVCISKLRAKLDDNPSAYIQTIRGLGYRLEK